MPYANQHNAPQLNRAVEQLVAGKPVIFPTDTVYGLGVSVRDCKTPACLYEIKNRKQKKPIAWLVGSLTDLSHYGCKVPDYACALAKKFWPGSLTLVVNASSNVPAAYVSAIGTIGLRMPANSVALDLIKALGCPIATTSANISGCASTNMFDALDKNLLAKVSVALRGGISEAKSGVASTVVSCTGNTPVVLRQGQVNIFADGSNV